MSKQIRRGATAAKEPEEAAPAELTIGDLTIHPEAYTVTKRGETIELTHREFELPLLGEAPWTSDDKRTFITNGLGLCIILRCTNSG